MSPKTTAEKLAEAKARHDKMECELKEAQREADREEAEEKKREEEAAKAKRKSEAEKRKKEAVEAAQEKRKKAAAAACIAKSEVRVRAEVPKGMHIGAGGSDWDVGSDIEIVGIGDVVSGRCIVFIFFDLLGCSPNLSKVPRGVLHASDGGMTAFSGNTMCHVICVANGT